MTVPPASLSSKPVTRAHQEIRGPEIGPALKRDRLLNRVRAARQRLVQTPPDTLARLR
ncbi:MAG: hypothetical protein ACTHLH_05550 [Solirubrobacterales bacterium]